MFAPEYAVARSQELRSEMKRLEVFVGDWVYEGEQAKSPEDLPFGGAGEFSGTITTHLILGGSFLESKMEDKNPAGTTSIVEMTKFY